MLLLWLSLAFLSTCLAQDEETTNTTNAAPKDSSYWVMMNRKIRPGIPLSMIAQIYRGTHPVTITLTLYNAEGNDVILTSKPAVVMPGDPQKIVIPIPPDLKKPGGEYVNTYICRIVGEGQDVSFNQTDYLTLETKSFSIFTQTDKGIYKPGQTVRYRALATWPDLTTLKDEPMDIFIKDPMGNRIQQHLGIKGPNGTGIVEQSLKLASKIPHGDWTIEVFVLGISKKVTFAVADYVLPPFEVKVGLPTFALVSDTFLIIDTKAMFTYGQPVRKARVTVLVAQAYNWQPNENITFSGEINKEGSFVLQVSTKRLLDLLQRQNTYISSLQYYTFNVSANVTEIDTDKMMTGSNTVQFYSSPVMISFPEISSSTFKPGLNYTGYLKVERVDGMLLTPEETKNFQLNISATYEVKIPQNETTTQAPIEETEPQADNSTESVNSKMAIRRPIWGGTWEPRESKNLPIENPIRSVPADGLITVSFQVPPEAVSVTIFARSTTSDEVSASKYLSKSESPSNTFLKLEVPPEKPKVGDKLEVLVVATELMKEIHYQIYSKASLVDFGVVRSPEIEGSKTTTWNILITRAMAPTMTIVAFSIRKENHEMVASSATLPVDGLFNNTYSIQFREEKVQPGQEVDLIIKAPPNSVVCFKALDKSLTLLTTGNEITQDNVRNELAEYDLGSGFPYFRFMFVCGWPSYHDGVDAASVFENIPLAVYTNAYLYKKPFANSWVMPFPLIIPEATTWSQRPDSSTEPPPAVRKHFPETWLFTSKYVMSEIYWSSWFLAPGEVIPVTELLTKLLILYIQNSNDRIPNFTFILVTLTLVTITLVTLALVTMVLVTMTLVRLIFAIIILRIDG